MPSSIDIPTLIVEGKDDLHTIAALLTRHGVNMDRGKRPFEIIIATDPVTGAEGLIPLLDNMTDAIVIASGRPIGFVLDIDVEVTNRWNVVSERLIAAGLTPPSSCPRGGSFGQLPNYPYRAGVWMMPDCVSDHGKLEHLLKSLVPASDKLWPHAKECTEGATRLGAAFREVDHEKAVTHCWLAWQKDPGIPFGTALTAEFFGHDSSEAMDFLRWLKSLFNLSTLAV